MILFVRINSNTENKTSGYIGDYFSLITLTQQLTLPTLDIWCERQESDLHFQHYMLI